MLKDHMESQSTGQVEQSHVLSRRSMKMSSYMFKRCPTRSKIFRFPDVDDVHDLFVATRTTVNHFRAHNKKERSWCRNKRDREQHSIVYPDWILHERKTLKILHMLGSCLAMPGTDHLNFEYFNIVMPIRFDKRRRLIASGRIIYSSCRVVKSNSRAVVSCRDFEIERRASFFGTFASHLSVAACVSSPGSWCWFGLVLLGDGARVTKIARPFISCNMDVWSETAFDFHPSRRFTGFFVFFLYDHDESTPQNLYSRRDRLSANQPAAATGVRTDNPHARWRRR